MNVLYVVIIVIKTKILLVLFIHNYVINAHLIKNKCIRRVAVTIIRNIQGNMYKDPYYEIFQRNRKSLYLHIRKITYNFKLLYV